MYNTKLFCLSPCDSSGDLDLGTSAGGLRSLEATNQRAGTGSRAKGMAEDEERLLQLRRSLADRRAEGDEVEALLRVLEEMRRDPHKPIETRVEVGEGLRVAAVVDPPHERVHVHRGLGIFVELQLDAAALLCASRLELLQRKQQLLREQEALLAGPSA